MPDDKTPFASSAALDDPDMEFIRQRFGVAQPPEPDPDMEFIRQRFSAAPTAPVPATGPGGRAAWEERYRAMRAAAPALSFYEAGSRAPGAIAREAAATGKTFLSGVAGPHAESLGQSIAESAVGAAQGVLDPTSAAVTGTLEEIGPTTREQTESASRYLNEKLGIGIPAAVQNFVQKAAETVSMMPVGLARLGVETAKAGVERGPRAAAGMLAETGKEAVEATVTPVWGLAKAIVKGNFGEAGEILEKDAFDVALGLSGVGAVGARGLGAAAGVAARRGAIGTARALGIAAKPFQAAQYAIDPFTPAGRGLTAIGKAKIPYVSAVARKLRPAGEFVTPQVREIKNFILSAGARGGSKGRSLTEAVPEHLRVGLEKLLHHESTRTDVAMQIKIGDRWYESSASAAVGSPLSVQDATKKARLQNELSGVEKKIGGAKRSVKARLQNELSGVEKKIGEANRAALFESAGKIWAGKPLSRVGTMGQMGKAERALFDLTSRRSVLTKELNRLSASQLDLTSKRSVLMKKLSDLEPKPRAALLDRLSVSQIDDLASGTSDVRYVPLTERGKEIAANANAYFLPIRRQFIEGGAQAVKAGYLKAETYLEHIDSYAHLVATHVASPLEKKLAGLWLRTSLAIRANVFRKRKTKDVALAQEKGIIEKDLQRQLMVGFAELEDFIAKSKGFQWAVDSGHARPHAKADLVPRGLHYFDDEKTRAGVSKWGPLVGHVVPEETWRYLRDLDPERVAGLDMGRFGLAVDRALRYWKFTKTVGNPATVLNNLYGNSTVLAEQAGIPLHSNARDYIAVTRDFVKGKMDDPYVRRWREAGGGGLGRYEAEAMVAVAKGIRGGVGRTRDIVGNTIGIVGRALDEGLKTVPQQAWRAGVAVVDALKAFYTASDEVFKAVWFRKAARMKDEFARTGMITRSMRRFHGKDAEKWLRASDVELAAEGARWFVDYKRSPEFLRLVSQGPGGTLMAPFASFPILAYPLQFQAMRIHPGRWLAYSIGAEWLNGMIRAVEGISEEEERAFKLVHAARTGSVASWLERDRETGEISGEDIGRRTPVSALSLRRDVGEEKPLLPFGVPGGLEPQGPATQLGIGTITGREPYFGTPLAPEAATTGQKALARAKFAARTLLPPWTPGVGIQAEQMRRAEGKAQMMMGTGFHRTPGEQRLAGWAGIKRTRINLIEMAEKARGHTETMLEKADSDVKAMGDPRKSANFGAIGSASHRAEFEERLQALAVRAKLAKPEMPDEDIARRISIARERYDAMVERMRAVPPRGTGSGLRRPSP